MNFRTDFVTNSSSSSFIISKKYLTEKQILAIKNHSKLAQSLHMDCVEEAWNIEENKDFITGWTYLNNFDMQKFLSTIDINLHTVTWDNCPFDLNDPNNNYINYQKEKTTWQETLDQILWNQF